MNNLATKEQIKDTVVIKAKDTKKLKGPRKKEMVKGFAVMIIITLLFAGSLVLSAPLKRVDETLTYNGNNPYIQIGKNCEVAAHRAGSTLAPENTLAAMDACVNSPGYKCDILEFDLHMTKDNQLILLHDDTLDRTSNACEFFKEEKVYASSKTLKQLQQLNMAENFQKNGKYEYMLDGKLTKTRGLRGNDIPEKFKIATLDQVFDYLKLDTDGKNLRFIIEIKDGGNLGRLATDKLYKTMVDRKIIDRAIVGTFESEITRYMDKKYPDIHRSAGVYEFLSFYLSFTFNVDLSGVNLGYDVMEIPYKQFVVNFGHKSMIDYAHKYGIALQFWTVNDGEEMQELIDAGADAIITDNPKLTYDLVKKHEAKEAKK